jgi:hypothetical protein
MRYLRRVDPSTRRDLPEWFRGGSLSPPWFPIRFFAVESGGAVKVLRQSPAECLLGLTEWTGVVARMALESGSLGRFSRGYFSDAE